MFQIAILAKRSKATVVRPKPTLPYAIKLFTAVIYSAE
jgi:hypothetical protein